MSRRSVRCYETGEVFDSLASASRKYGVDKEAIRVVLNDPHRISAGYHWCDTANVDYVPFDEVRTKINKRRIRCIETGVEYSSVREAVKALGNKSISSCLIGKCKTAAGYHWEYVDKNASVRVKIEPNEPTEDKPPEAFYIPDPNPQRKVRCLETGQIFNGVREAANSYGINSGELAMSLKEGKHTRGYHWEYVDKDKNQED